MMRLFLLSAFVLTLFSVPMAQAAPKLLGLFWTYETTSKLPTQYYFEHPKWGQPAQFANTVPPFKSESWTSQRDNPAHLLQEWQANNIVGGLGRNCQGVRVVKVGGNFHHLSYADKARVIKTVADHHKLVTHKPGFIYVRDRESCDGDYIGTFDASNGLILR
ncbi:MAG: hypothetical protein V4621_01280 [Pseudomonadota bacterium]